MNRTPNLIIAASLYSRMLALSSIPTVQSEGGLGYALDGTTWTEPTSSQPEPPDPAPVPSSMVNTMASPATAATASTPNSAFVIPVTIASPP